MADNGNRKIDDELPSTSGNCSNNIEYNRDSNVGNVPSTSGQSNKFTLNQSLIKPLSENEQTDELAGLGISAYDQTEFESEVIAQVNEHIKIQEDEARKKRAKKELGGLVDELRLIKRRLLQIDKALEMSPKENNELYTKQAKKFVLSIKQERENKTKQLKKLEAKQKMLLKQCESGATFESMEELINEDEDVVLDDETMAHLESVFGKKETEQEKLIKTGQMTPFGTVMNKTALPKLKASNTEMTEFEKYLLDQSSLQQQRKKTIKRKGKPASSAAEVKKKKLVKMNKDSVEPSSSKSFSKTANIPPLKTEIIDSDDANVNDGNNAISTKYSSVFPKIEDKQWSDNDSDWLPDSDQDEESIDASVRQIKNSYKQQFKGNLIPIDLSDDESYKRKKKTARKSNNLKTIDDGDQETYLNRLRQFYKEKLCENQTKDRANLEEDEELFEEFDGGFKIPNEIWNKLYDYQKTGVRWLWELHLQNCGGILGDEMGLGKTIQMISLLVGLNYSNLSTRGDQFRGLGPTFIVCPTTLMHQWVKEFHTWWPPFRVAVLHETGSHLGTKEALVRNVYNSNGVIITSYNAVVKHQDLLVPRDWHYVILDEGHKIRNPDAQITLACKQLKTSHRILLSGSPVQNNLKELWSLFDFIFPGKLGTLPVFMQQFSVPIVQGGYTNASQVQVHTAYKCALVLRNTINPYLLRRMKNDVKMSLHLPNKNEQVLFCKLTSDQLRCYKQYLESGEVHNILKGTLKVFMGLIALRKICNHPDLYSGGPEKILVSNNITEEQQDPEMRYGFFERAGKMLVIDALLKLWKKQGHRVLLFSQSKQMLDILESYVQSKKYTYMRMDGGTSIGSRQPAVNKFNADSGIFIFLLTTRVGGLGVNLTGANRVVIYDPDWNPSTDTQARERAWRIGQQKNVTIYRLLTSGTIEEKIYHRQIFKQFLTNKILKDPKQRRFFKNNELHELFTLSELGKEGTETHAIFAGTGSDVKVTPQKQSKKKLKDQKSNSEISDEKQKKMRELAKRLSKMIANPNFNPKKKIPNKKKKKKKKDGKVIEGSRVLNVAKQEVFKQEDKEEEQQSLKQDDYVLQKLFSTSGVHSALKHDIIMDSADPDYMLVEGEAEKVAKDAVNALKKSRRDCPNSKTGIPTWTGRNGALNSPKKPKFGNKKNTKLLENKRSNEKTETVVVKSSLEESEDIFSGKKKDKEANENPSSSSILGRILQRSSTMPDSDDSNSDDENQPDTNLTIVAPDHEDLISDIQSYIAFQASKDGEATTNELLEKFKEKLPPKNSALFKSMLNQICTFHRNTSNDGIWRLKPEFR